MLDVITFIVSSGPNVFKENLIETIFSISKNIGDCEHKYYIVVDDVSTEKFIKDVFSNDKLSKVIKPDSLLEIVYSRNSWAKDFNSFFEKHQDSSKYLLISHDDLTINTPNFFKKSMKEIEGFEDQIGWIVYTNDRYHRDPCEPDRGPRSNFAGPGFALDRDRDPYVYECHNFSEGTPLTKENEHLLDFPKAAVKCYGPFDLMLISAAAMKKIGPCSDWTPYTMLIDEDWALESLKNNLVNVWIPDVFMTHPNPKQDHRRKGDLRYQEMAHEAFYTKWGFLCHRYTPEVIEMIKEKYKDTNIPWSIGRNTYDWEYLNSKYNDED